MLSSYKQILKRWNDGKTRYYNALMRHLSSYADGELIDSESGESHLAHALCNLYFQAGSIKV